MKKLSYYQRNRERIIARVSQRYYENREAKSEYDKERMRDPKAKLKRNKAVADWKRRNPEKRKAQSAVSNAIRDGRLKREKCEICGEKGHAHHDDYSKPFEVRWLCRGHHKERHHAEYEGRR